MSPFCWCLNLERYTLLVAYDDLDAELVNTPSAWPFNVWSMDYLNGECSVR